MREYNFDGLVGPTHNYAGLSHGNLASTRHAGTVGNPKAAALQGLAKMRFVAQLGVGQAVLPPAPRPDLRTLRALGFIGSDSDVVKAAGERAPELLRWCSSASSMWTANAATVAPSCDAEDGRAHFTIANLAALFHRSLEPRFTFSTFERLFSDRARFVVHEPLPGGIHFSDEGAANHSRLVGSSGVVHLFGWGRTRDRASAEPQRFPARQSYEASQAIARLHQLPASRALLWQQTPAGIDQGAFHSDVLAVANRHVLLCHELAFADHPELLRTLSSLVGPDFRAVVASEAELPVADAVSAYPFNSQLLSLPSGKMALIAPQEAAENPASRRYLDRVLGEEPALEKVHFLDVNASMKNGGGPACLRLRVPLTDDERSAVSGRVFLDDALYSELKVWIERHYRDRLTLADMADPSFIDEVRIALDALSQLLQLPNLYEFQHA